MAAIPRTYKLYQAAAAGSAGATYVTAVANHVIKAIQISGYVQGAAANDSAYYLELSLNPNYGVITHDALGVLATVMCLVEFDTAVGRQFSQINTVLAPLSFAWAMGERIYLNTAYGSNQPAGAAITAVVYVA